MSELQRWQYLADKLPQSSAKLHSISGILCIHCTTDQPCKSKAYSGLYIYLLPEILTEMLTKAQELRMSFCSPAIETTCANLFEAVSYFLQTSFIANRHIILLLYIASSSCWHVIITAS